MFPRFRKEDTSASRQDSTKSGQCPPKSQPDERVVEGIDASDAVLATQVTEELHAAPIETGGEPSPAATGHGSEAGAAARLSAENVSAPPPRVDVEPTASTGESDKYAEVSAGDVAGSCGVETAADGQPAEELQNEAAHAAVPAVARGRLIRVLTFAFFFGVVSLVALRR